MALIQFDKSDMEVQMSNLDQRVQMQTDIAGDHIVDRTEKDTFPYVPEEQHYLVAGFTSKVVTNTPKLQIDMMYNAYSNRGFNYAEIQHKKALNHFGPEKKYIKPGATDHYMTKGLSHVNVEQLYAFHISKVL